MLRFRRARCRCTLHDTARRRHRQCMRRACRIAVDTHRRRAARMRTRAEARGTCVTSAARAHETEARAHVALRRADEAVAKLRAVVIDGARVAAQLLALDAGPFTFGNELLLGDAEQARGALIVALASEAALARCARRN